MKWLHVQSRRIVLNINIDIPVARWILIMQHHSTIVAMNSIPIMASVVHQLTISVAEKSRCTIINFMTMNITIYSPTLIIDKTGPFKNT